MLTAGNERFVSGQMESRDLMAEVAATAGGQSPFAIVVGCLDSRAAPEFVFDQGIGDIFVARVAGNFVNTDIIGSLEFGTALVGSKLIVVLGHTECGAVKGACDGAQLGNLTQTLSNLTPALYSVSGGGDRSSSNAAFVQKVADANVKLTVQALTDRSQVMSDLVNEGKLDIVGAMYDVATGRVTVLD
jgi:carbonic anhydrase